MGIITPPARELLASIAASDLPYTDEDMPAAVLSLAGFVRSAPHAAQGGANVVTVPAEDSWVTLHASRPGSASDARVAIVIERASAARSATVRLDAFGATAREREAATLLARGIATAPVSEASLQTDLEHCTSPPRLLHRSSTGTWSLMARPCFRSATGSCRSASANG